MNFFKKFNKNFKIQNRKKPKEEPIKCIMFRTISEFDQEIPITNFPIIKPPRVKPTEKNVKEDSLKKIQSNIAKSDTTLNTSEEINISVTENVKNEETPQHDTNPVSEPEIIPSKEEIEDSKTNPEEPSSPSYDIKTHPEYLKKTVETITTSEIQNKGKINNTRVKRDTKIFKSYEDIPQAIDPVENNEQSEPIYYFDESEDNTHDFKVQKVDFSSDNEYYNTDEIEDCESRDSVDLSGKINVPDHRETLNLNEMEYSLSSARSSSVSNSNDSFQYVRLKNDFDNSKDEEKQELNTFGTSQKITMEPVDYRSQVTNIFFDDTSSEASA